MKLEDYKNNIELYEDFSLVIKNILEIALKKTKKFNVYYIANRAKNFQSLKYKIENKYKDKKHDNIQEFITDLAGCRIIFYYESEINEFINSGIINQNFEIDERSIKHDSKHKKNANDYYAGYHYIVKLKDERLSLIEYEKFKNLFCEIQLHSALDNIYSSLTHKIVYKNNNRKNFGKDRIDLIDKKLCEIQEKYLKPAKNEFEEIRYIFECYYEKIELFKSETFEKAKAGLIYDENKLFDFLKRYKSLLNYYKNPNDLSDDVFKICSNSINLIENKILFKNIDIKNVDLEIIYKSLEILDNCRYLIVVDNSIDLLIKIFGISDNIDKKINDNLKNLSKYEIKILTKYGFGFYFDLIEKIKRIGNINVILIISSNLLSCEASSEDHNFDSFSFSRGIIPVNQEIKTIRSEIISILKNLFLELNKTKNIDKLIEVIEVLNQGCNESYDDNKNPQRYYELLKLVLENTIEIINFYQGQIVNSNENKINQIDFKIIKKIEDFLARIYRRSINDKASEIKDLEQDNQLNEIKTEIKKLNDQINKIIEKFAEIIFENQDYNIYRNLSDHYANYIFDLKILIQHKENFHKNFIEQNRKENIEFIKQYSNQINHDNLTKSLNLIAKVINDSSKSNFAELIFIQLANNHPDLAKDILNNRISDLKILDFNDENIAISSLLYGLNQQNPNQAEEIILNYISQDIYLKDAILSLQAIKNNIKIELLEKLFNKANQEVLANKKSNDILLNFLMIYRFYENKNEQNFNQFILKIIKKLIEYNNENWLEGFYNLDKLFEQIDEIPDIELILNFMVKLKKIDYEHQRILGTLLKKYPNQVLKFFDDRLNKKDSQDHDYQRIPYDFNDTLQQKLANNHLEKIIEFAKKNYEKDNQLFIYQWGKILKIIYGNLPQNFTDKLMTFINSNNHKDLDFAIKIIRSITNMGGCKNIENLKFVIKQIILNPLFETKNFELENTENDDSQNTKYYREIAISLINFGAFMGERHDALEAKLHDLKDWQNDEHEKIRKFYQRFETETMQDIKNSKADSEKWDKQRRLEYENS